VYYIALACQLLASLYAAFAIPETLPPADEPEDSEQHITGTEGELEEMLVAPIKPLGLLLPRRNVDTGRLQWKLSFLTISVFMTTCGVSVGNWPPG
jgi:hypothetical protein